MDEERDSQHGDEGESESPEDVPAAEEQEPDMLPNPRNQGPTAAEEEDPVEPDEAADQTTD